MDRTQHLIIHFIEHTQHLTISDLTRFTHQIPEEI
jgi:hypothetical protein